MVEVPRDRMASPGVESATTVAGLSPVNGAMVHSRREEVRDSLEMIVQTLTGVKAPTLDPPGTNRTEDCASRDWLRPDLLPQLWAAARFQ